MRARAVLLRAVLLDRPLGGHDGPGTWAQLIGEGGYETMEFPPPDIPVVKRDLQAPRSASAHAASWPHSAGQRATGAHARVTR
jgi:hypothetical protein